MWLTVLILALLLLDDMWLFSLLRYASKLTRYAQIYSTLAVSRLLFIISFHLFAPQIEWLCALGLVGLGVLAHLVAVRHLPLYSDVLLVTEEAARTILSGGNPYTHVF